MIPLDQQAVHYIETFGSPLERWRVRRLTDLTETLPADWASHQTPEGG